MFERRSMRDTRWGCFFGQKWINRITAGAPRSLISFGCPAYLKIVCLRTIFGACLLSLESGLGNIDCDSDSSDPESDFSDGIYVP
jgi:hypothetical protein